MYFSQKFLIRVGAAVLAFGLAQTAFVPVASAQGIFTFKGKSYNRGDLPIAEQNNLFEAEEENFTRVQGIVDNTLISMHVAELAAKSGKSTAAVEEELFKVAEPTDKDAKDWYEANKARIPYPFDKIQNDVKQLLKGEKQREKRTQLVDKLKKDGGFTMHVARPTAPSVQVAFEGHPMKGNATAKVTIVEFADYQCPHCKAAAEAMKKVFDKYKDKIRFYFIDFPINPSGISTKVAEAAYCAKAQNKYWEFHEKAYEQQANLTAEWSATAAKELGLNVDTFNKCAASQEAKDFVAKGKAEGQRVGVSGTPTIYINGKRTHAHDEAGLEQAIKDAIKEVAS